MWRNIKKLDGWLDFRGRGEKEGKKRRIARKFMKLCICNAWPAESGLCVYAFVGTRERKRETPRIAARNQPGCIRPGDACSCPFECMRFVNGN